MAQFGVDWEGLLSAEHNDDTVEVPETTCPLTSADMVQLQADISPLSESSQYGMDLYEKALQFVSHRVGIPF